MATIRVCDVCMDANRPTAQYAIGSEERSVEVDLCEQHADAAPLRKLLGEGRPREATKLRPLPRDLTLTMEEIEARKEKG